AKHRPCCAWPGPSMSNVSLSSMTFACHLSPGAARHPAISKPRLRTSPNLRIAPSGTAPKLTTLLTQDTEHEQPITSAATERGLTHNRKPAQQRRGQRHPEGRIPGPNLYGTQRSD